MAKYEITAPDGQKYEITAPDNASEQEVMAYAQSQWKQPAKPQTAPPQKQQFGTARNIGMGALKGATDIGATLLSPRDWLEGKVNAIADKMAGVSGPPQMDRRAELNKFYQENANPDSLAFQGGALTSQVAGTAGVPAAMARGASPLLTKIMPNAAPKIVTALESGGFKIGPKATTIPGKFANAAIRTGAGAATGAATVGMVNPEDVATGAVLGAAMPATFKAAGEAGKFVSKKAIKPVARRLMQSAVKPTIEQLRKGDAQIAIDTLLDYGINPTKSGVDKMRGMVDDINNQISDKILNSSAVINKQDVLPYLDDTFQTFMSQVSPTSDINAIKGVADDFLKHPALPTDQIPVQAAQNLKQGTYRALSKKYGQMGSADVEAQKALARGLKENIANAVPGVGQLNAEETRLLKTLTVAERRALMELNKNPMGLSLLAGNKAALVAFMADRSAAFKSLAARMVNQAAKAPAALDPLADKFSNPLLRSGGLLAIESNP
jgi:hypothetical protein